MPITPNGIYYADTSTSMSAEAISAAEATSVDDAIQTLIVNNRQLQDYRWADSAARAAQAGMGEGDEGYQIDTKIIYRYSSGAWRIWSTLTPVAFTPTWTNLTVGDGTQDWVYNISSGRVFISGTFTLGSTSAVGTNPYFSLPVAGTFTDAQVLGDALFDDAGVRYRGGVHYDNALSSPLVRRFFLSGSEIIDAGISATAPFTWATGDRISATFAYRAA